MQQSILGAAGVMGALGVAAAAWVQHLLVAGADAAHLDFAATAVRFALIHAAVLVGIAAYLRDGIGRGARICLAAAAASFCGGLWLLATGGSPAWARAVPVGGTLFIVGWLAVLAAALAPRPTR